MAKSLRRTTRSSAEHEWQDIATDAGVEVSELMREVAEFRVALSADMTIAAAAAELGETELAAGLIEAERAHLAAFEIRAHEALLRNPPPKPVRQHLRDHRVAKALVMAAAAVALVGSLGVAVGRGHPSSGSSSTDGTLALAAAARYADFSRIATGENVTASTMIAAATRLHASLASLAINDPKDADQVVGILNSEQQQLLKWLPPGTTTVLEDAKALVAQLRLSAPGLAGQVIGAVTIASPPNAARPPSAKVPTKPVTSATPSPQPSPSAGSASIPTAKPTIAPAPQPSATTPEPSVSPSPSKPPLFPGGPDIL